MTEHPNIQLAAYLDQELDAQQLAAFDAHLQACPLCRAELEEHMALRQLLEALPPVPQQTNVGQFWAELEPQLHQRRTRLGLAWLWGIALAVVVVVIQAFFIALRLAQALDAAGWLPTLQTPGELSNRWSLLSLPGVIQSVFLDNGLIGWALDSPITPFFPYLSTLVVSSFLALIFLGWAYAYLCPQSTLGCQPIRK